MFYMQTSCFEVQCCSIIARLSCLVKKYWILFFCMRRGMWLAFLYQPRKHNACSK